MIKILVASAKWAPQSPHVLLNSFSDGVHNLARVRVLGDVLSSFLFGAFVSIFPIIAGLFIGIEIANLLVLVLGVVLATFCFASLSILLSSYPPTDTPASVMMISSMIKFPLVFISGIFIPIEDLQLGGKLSPQFLR
jgi:ABC-2 type transport system permease protein